MFTDQELALKEIGKVVPKLSDLGIKSVAGYLGFKPVVVNALQKRNLLEVVLEELSRRNPDELCSLRSFDDTPVGIPSGATASEVNEFLDVHSEFTGLIEHPFTTTIFNKKIDTDIEMLQNDVFNVNYSASINVLMDRVVQRIALLRKVCTNGAMVKDKALTIKTSLSGFDPGFESFNENRSEIIEKIRRSLSILSARKPNVLDLKYISDTAAILSNDVLKGYLKEARKTILDNWELPVELPRGFGGEQDEDDYTIDLFKLPKSWKQTATLENSSVYDLWNVMTSEVTKVQNLKLFDVDTILKAQIKVAGILQPVKNTDTLIAKKRTS